MWRMVVTGLVGLCMSTLACGQSLPRGFIANAGQDDPRIAHRMHLPGRDVFVARDGALVHRFHGSDSDWVLVERFSHGRVSSAEGERPLPARISLVAADGRRSVAQHRQLRRRAVWAGIDVVWKAHADAVETQYDVSPEGDVADIAVALDGATALRLVDDGGLRIGTGLGELALSEPVAWQVIAGRRIDVPVRYTLRSDGYGFVVGDHDDTRTLHIDPVLRSTFVGGNSDEWIDELALADDSVYVAGYTQSANFPGTTGGAQPTIIRNTTLGGNIFVARYSRDLSQLLQATYFGAFLPFGGGGQSGGPGVRALLVNGDSVYITGQTVPGAIATGQVPGAQTSPGSDVDAFVARFNRSLTTLLASSYVGGNNNDIGHALAADATSVYVVGSTSSSNLPATAGAAVPSVVNPVNGDAFVTRFSRDLTSILRSTYTRGGGSGSGEGLAALRDGDDLYIAGGISSGLSQTTGAFQPNPVSTGFFTDGFVARFSADLGTLHRASYLGGTASERVRAIAANATAIYLAGDADPSANFPLPANAPDATFQQGEGFVFAISRDLGTRIGASLIGGMGGDSVADVAADATRVVVAGSTNASDFPGVAGGLESTNPTSQIAGFVSRFNVDLSSLQQSTYFGVGTGQKQVYGLGVDGADIYLGGRMPGGTLPNTGGAAQPNHGGSAYDGFITRLSADLQAPQPQSDLAITKTGSPDLEYNHYLIYTIEVRNLGPDAVIGASVSDLLPGAQLVAANWACVGSAGGSCSGNSGSGSIAATTNLPVNGIATFTLCARYAGGGADVVNTATVAVPANHGDPNPGNNSASHTVVDPSLFKDGFEDVAPPALCSGL